MLSLTSSLDEAQTHLASIFTRNNDRLHQNADLAIMLQKASTYLLKGVRKSQEVRVLRGLADVVGWTFAISNRLTLPLVEEVAAHYPNVCPYCGVAPCDPSLHDRHGRKDLSHLSFSLEDRNLQYCQDMFAHIYPMNMLSDSAQHLVEETAEVGVAIHAYEKTSRPQLLCHVGLELVDVFAHACAVATCMDLHISQIVLDSFGTGCPGCRLNECKCTFESIIGI